MCRRFQDKVEERQFEELLSQKMSHATVGLVDGAIVEVTDESQGDVKIKLVITHRSQTLVA